MLSILTWIATLLMNWLCLDDRAVKHVRPTCLQVANIFTKVLPHPLFELFRFKLRVGFNLTLNLTESVRIH